MKRLFTILLTIMMALCIIGIPVTAESDSEEKPVESDRSVAIWTNNHKTVYIGNTPVQVTVSGYKYLDVTNTYIESYDLYLSVPSGYIIYPTGYSVNGFVVTVSFLVESDFGYTRNSINA